MHGYLNKIPCRKLTYYHLWGLMNNPIKEIKNTKKVLSPQSDVQNTFSLWEHSPYVPHFSKPTIFGARQEKSKWRRQICVLSVALAVRIKITAEKSEMEITVITSANVILMKPSKVASFQGQWGEIRSDLSACCLYGQAVSVTKTAQALSQGWAVEPMKEEARLMLNA